MIRVLLALAFLSSCASPAPSAQPENDAAVDGDKTRSTLRFVQDSIQRYSPCDPARPLSEYFCIGSNVRGAVDETQFRGVPSLVFSLFQTEMDRTGRNIEVDAKWHAPYLGAGMGLGTSTTGIAPFRLIIFGGTARAPGMTLDAYRAIVCHEFGHILGGAPLQLAPLPTWSTAEGQADHFAARVCLPRVFRSLGVRERDIPARVEQAGFDMLKALSPYSTETRTQPLVRFSADRTQVPATLTNQYPSVQCRYESFRAPNVQARCWFAPR